MFDLKWLKLFCLWHSNYWVLTGWRFMENSKSSIPTCWQTDTTSRPYFFHPQKTKQITFFKIWSWRCRCKCRAGDCWTIFSSSSAWTLILYLLYQSLVIFWFSVYFFVIFWSWCFGWMCINTSMHYSSNSGALTTFCFLVMIDIKKWETSGNNCQIIFCLWGMGRFLRCAACCCCTFGAGSKLSFAASYSIPYNWDQMLL